MMPKIALCLIVSVIPRSGPQGLDALAQVLVTLSRWITGRMVRCVGATTTGGRTQPVPDALAQLRIVSAAHAS
jgi:hypothetical protein